MNFHCIPLTGPSLSSKNVNYPLRKRPDHQHSGRQPLQRHYQRSIPLPPSHNRADSSRISENPAIRQRGKQERGIDPANRLTRVQRRACTPGDKLICSPTRTGGGDAGIEIYTESARPIEPIRTNCCVSLRQYEWDLILEVPSAPPAAPADFRWTGVGGGRAAGTMRK